MSKFQRHVFVCQNARIEAGKPSCGGRGGAEVLARLEAAIASRPELSAQVAATGCACLGPCFDGPALVVYPDGVWYAGVAPDDVAELVEEHLVGGRPVERLRYRWGDED